MLFFWIWPGMPGKKGITPTIKIAGGGKLPAI